MKKLVWLCMLFFPLSVQAQPQWHVETASVTFEIKNAGLPVHGSFEGFEADLRFDPQRPERGVITASVDAATVQTGIGLRDKHLRNHDYFEVTQYPRIRMQSIGIRQIGRAIYEGMFALTIKAVQQEVTVPFSFEHTDKMGTLEGSFTIDRLDFGLGDSSLILSDAVEIHIVVNVLAKSAEKRSVSY